MLQGTKKTIIFISVLFMILGLLLIIWPATVRAVICYILGAVFVIFGIIKLFRFFRSKENAVSLAIGIVCTILGIFVLVRAQALALIFSVIAGIAIIFDSIIRLQGAFAAKKEGAASWKKGLVIALILLAFGIFLLFDPFAGLDAAAIVAGIVLLLDGIAGIYMVNAVK